VRSSFSVQSSQSSNCHGLFVVIGSIGMEPIPSCMYRSSYRHEAEGHVDKRSKRRMDGSHRCRPNSSMVDSAVAPAVENIPELL